MKYIGTYKEILGTMKKSRIKNTIGKEGGFKVKVVFQMCKAIRKEGDKEEEGLEEGRDNKEEVENKERVDSKEEVENME